MENQRNVTFVHAVNEATDQCMAGDPSVFIMGLGVPDPKRIFGTTQGLLEKYGPSRVLDMPVAENGMTGVALGAAISGLRPVLTHQRVDFMLLSLEQIINQMAKWHYMFDGKARVPVVIRMIVGRGWGQGPQHSQSLHTLFAHIPGLKVVMPFTPYDAKGLLVSAIRDENPVIFIEHRWLHSLKGEVPVEIYEVPIGHARVVREGSDVTLVALSHMTYEALRAARILGKAGIDAEVVDLRSLLPFDAETVIGSVKKTGRLVVCDVGSRHCGFGGEVIATVCENAFGLLKSKPVRIALPDYPLPSSPGLSEHFYPGVDRIVDETLALFGREATPDLREKRTVPHDVPDMSFTGPF